MTTLEGRRLAVTVALARKPRRRVSGRMPTVDLLGVEVLLFRRGP